MGMKAMKAGKGTKLMTKTGIADVIAEAAEIKRSQATKALAALAEVAAQRSRRENSRFQACTWSRPVSNQLRRPASARSLGRHSPCRPSRSPCRLLSQYLEK